MQRLGRDKAFPRKASWAPIYPRCRARSTRRLKPSTQAKVNYAAVVMPRSGPYTCTRRGSRHLQARSSPAGPNPALRKRPRSGEIGVE